MNQLVDGKTYLHFIYNVSRKDDPMYGYKCFNLFSWTVLAGLFYYFEFIKVFSIKTKHLHLVVFSSFYTSSLFVWLVYKLQPSEYPLIVYLASLVLELGYASDFLFFLP